MDASRTADVMLAPYADLAPRVRERTAEVIRGPLNDLVVQQLCGQTSSRGSRVLALHSLAAAYVGRGEDPPQAIASALAETRRHLHEMKATAQILGRVDEFIDGVMGKPPMDDSRSLVFGGPFHLAASLDQAILNVIANIADVRFRP